MSVSSEATPTVGRKRPEWMTPTDEQILDTMDDEGNLTPDVLEKRYEVCRSNYASNRLSHMADEGYVERLGTGLYRLTDLAHAFLNGTLDPDAGVPDDTEDESDE